MVSQLAAVISIPQELQKIKAFGLLLKNLGMTVAPRAVTYVEISLVWALWTRGGYIIGCTSRRSWSGKETALGPEEGRLAACDVLFVLTRVRRLQIGDILPFVPTGVRALPGHSGSWGPC